jgi:hypothetical protein
LAISFRRYLTYPVTVGRRHTTLFMTFQQFTYLMKYTGVRI